MGDSRGDFDRQPTCECVARHGVYSQGCYDYKGNGWCGVHVTQYQRNEGPVMSPKNYRFTINIKVANGKPIGEHDMVHIPDDETRKFDSLLPELFMVNTLDGDGDAIYAHYRNQHFTSDDQEHHYRFGKDDNGKRQGDCGLSC